MEQIGLQAVFEYRDYQAGVKRYIQAQGQAEKSTTNFASVVKTASIVITGVSSAINVAQQSMRYLQQAYDATVGSANQFNGYIEETSRLTGTGAEETSRLVIAMQKLGIQQSTINTTICYRRLWHSNSRRNRNNQNKQLINSSRKQLHKTKTKWQ